MKYEDFIKRIRKSLYYGVGTPDTEMSVSLPFAEYAADLFSETHRGHSLHRLSCVSAAQVHATPCSLIMALIYLDRLNVIDSGYSCRITPQQLFVVSLVSTHSSITCKLMQTTIWTHRKKVHGYKCRNCSCWNKFPLVSLSAEWKMTMILIRNKL